MPDEILGLNWIIEGYTFLSTQRNNNGFIDYNAVNIYCNNNDLETNLLTKYIFRIDEEMRR